MIVKLTEYETGATIYVQREAIVSCRLLKAEVYTMPGETPQEEGNRTRIDTSTDMFLVQESPEYVLGLEEADNG